MKRVPANILLTAASSLVLSVLFGCGTGQYEARMRASVEKLHEESGFQDMSPPAKVPGTDIEFQLPAGFDQPPWVVEDSPSVAEVRLKPTAFVLPGHKLTCEKLFVFDGNARRPYYCYIAVTENTPERSQSRLVFQRVVKIKKEGEKAKWSDVQFAAPTGGKVDWQHFTVQGEQKFYCIDDNGEEQTFPLDGIIDVYLRQVDDQLVWIVWRVPMDVFPHIKDELKDMAEKVAGSVRKVP